VQTPGTATQYRGSEVTISGDVGRYIYTLDGNGFAASWELFLNLDSLAANHSWVEYPQIGDRGNMAAQRGAGDVTDALVPAVPAPGAFALLGLGGFLAARRRRSN
jgi:MYXO-CTERM domain-containing protein